MKFIIALLLFVSSAASATPQLMFLENGNLSGIWNIDVQGHAYDVHFRDGSCQEIFGCLPGADFIFDSVGAQAASNALLGIFENNPHIDQNPDLVLGCTGTTARCYIWTPHLLNTFHSGIMLVSAVVFINEDHTSSNLVGDGTIGTLNDLEQFPRATWADWTLSEHGNVPEPGLLALLGIGFLAFRVSKR